MTETVEIYFDDLKPEAQSNLIEKFQTTEKNENWDKIPLAIIEWRSGTFLDKLICRLNLGILERLSNQYIKERPRISLNR